MQDRSFFSRSAGTNPASPKTTPPVFTGSAQGQGIAPGLTRPQLAQGTGPSAQGAASAPSNAPSVHSPAAPSPSSQPSSSSVDDLTRVFNSSLVATRGRGARDFSSEILEVAQSPAFRAILFAVRQHARTQGIPDRQAAEQVIQAFRRMDQAWADYVFQEGLDRLKGRS